MVRKIVSIENNGQEIKDTNFFSYQSKVIPKFDFYLSYYPNFFRLLIFDPERLVKIHLENATHIFIRFEGPKIYDNDIVGEDSIIITLRDNNKNLYSMKGSYQNFIDFETNFGINDSIQGVLVYYSEDYTIPDFKIFKLKMDEKLIDFIHNF